MAERGPEAVNMSKLVGNLSENHFIYQVETPQWFRYSAHAELGWGERTCRYCGKALLDGEIVAEDADGTWLHESCFEPHREDEDE